MSTARARAAILATVTKEGVALQYVSDALRADREVVLAAVNQHGGALEYASAALRDDREVALAAVSQNGKALTFASTALCAGREVVLAAVKQCGMAIGVVPIERKTKKIDPLIRSWLALPRVERNWRRCREAYKCRSVLWFWMEETVKRVHKEAPPLAMGWEALEEPPAKRARGRAA